MDYEVETIQEVNLKGLKTRADNSANIAKIPELWDRFINTGVDTPSIYAVYTEYEKDENGPYTFLLGTDGETTALKDCVTLTLPAGKYAVFTIPHKDAVMEVWQFVWQRTLERTYVADFEVYSAENEEVKIYVGIK